MPLGSSKCSIITYDVGVVTILSPSFQMFYFCYFFCDIKGKVFPLQARCSTEGGQRYSSTLPLSRHQKGVSGQQQAPVALYPRERPSTHFTEDCVGPRAGLDGRKISSPPEFDLGPSSPQSVTILTELPRPIVL